MTRMTKSLIAALTLIATITAAGPALAQSAPLQDQGATPSDHWVVKSSPTENQSVGLLTRSEDTDALFSPWASQDPDLIPRIETPIYAQTDLTRIQYSVLGPVKLGVQPDYQALHWFDNTLPVSDIAYLSSDSSPYSQTPYQVATTATAQVKFIF